MILKRNLPRRLNRGIDAQVAIAVIDQLAHDFSVSGQVIEAMCGHGATRTRHVDLQLYATYRQRLADPCLFRKGVIGFGDVD